MMIYDQYLRFMVVRSHPRRTRPLIDDNDEPPVECLDRDMLRFLMRIASLRYQMHFNLIFRVSKRHQSSIDNGPAA